MALGHAIGVHGTRLHPDKFRLVRENEPFPVRIMDGSGYAPLTSVFGELITGEAHADIQYQFTANVAPESFILGPTGTGSIGHGSAMAEIHSGIGIGLGRLTSRSGISYRAGHEAFGVFTTLYATPEANTEQHAGLHDDENGFYIGYSNTDFGIGRIYNSSPFFTPQSEFNKDTLDGSNGSKNSSGFKLDQTKLNIYGIRYGFLGIAPIRYFVFAGEMLGWLNFHTIDLTNKQTTPHTLNPNLPFRFDCQRLSGTGPDMVMKTASIEAGTVGSKRSEAGERHFTARTTKAGITALVPILSIKNKLTYPTANPVNNHISNFLEFISVAADGTKNVTVLIIKDPVLTGAVFVDKDADNSTAQTDISATALTGGKELIPIELSKTGSQLFVFGRSDLEVEPGAIYTIAATSANATEVSVGLHWNERH